MKKAISPAIILFMLLILCYQAYGLTLDEAVAIALENNHRVKQYAYIQEAADEQTGTARAGFMPSLNLGASYIEREEGLTLGKKSTIYSAEASYNLFSGFSDRNLLKGAKSRAEAAGFGRRAVIADVILDVKAAFIDVLKAERKVETASESVELLEKQKHDSELFLREGLIARNDLLKVEVELASARQELLKAEGDRNVALQKLQRTTGASLSEEEKLVDFTELPKTTEITYDVLRDEMLGRRSELGYLRAQLSASRYQMDSIRGGYFPRLDVVLTYEKYEHSELPGGGELSGDETTAMLRATWNIFDGLARQHRIKEADFTADALDEQIKDTGTGGGTT